MTIDSLALSLPRKKRVVIIIVIISRLLDGQYKTDQESSEEERALFLLMYAKPVFTIPENAWDTNTAAVWDAIDQMADVVDPDYTGSMTLANCNDALQDALENL